MEVRFEKIVKRYGETFAVRDLTLKITDGALHFLLGPSGCGKTTALRMLAGLEAPTSGQILFDGKDVTKVPAAERGIGMVFQNYALWPHMTVRKNIEYGLKLKKLGPVETQKRLDEAVAMTQLGPYVERMPGQLSGGQQQRVALARALAIRPAVLLLDEPLSNLDAKLRHEMRDNISRIHKATGITTVYVTHDQKEALSMGSSISVMRAGDLIQTDAPRKLYHDPATPFIAGFIGETNLLPGTYRGKEGDVHVVETPVGTLKAKRGRDAAFGKAGGAVMVSFRPEALKVDFAGTRTDMPNAMQLKVDHVTYLGESEQLGLKAPGDVSIKANIFNPPDHGLKDGAAVSCWLEPEDLLVLPVERDLTSGT